MRMFLTYTYLLDLDIEEEKLRNIMTKTQNNVKETNTKCEKVIPKLPSETFRII